MGILSQRVASFKEKVIDAFGPEPGVVAEVLRLEENAAELDRRLSAPIALNSDIRSLSAAFLVNLDSIEKALGLEDDPRIVVVKH